MDFEGLEIGDILICKSFSFLGAGIGLSFRCDSPITWHGEYPERPSSHNGVVGINARSELVVYEALLSGVVETPIETYVGAAKQGKCEIKFARLTDGLNFHQKNEINRWCISKLGTKYDFRSYLSHIWRLALRMPPIWNSNRENNFYCTEYVQGAYMRIVIDIMRKTLPAPITVEKRVADKTLMIVAEYWKH